MILVSKILEAAHCHGTHHKLAFSSLDHFRNPEKSQWKDFFLSRHAAYLRGSKAPDQEFKDFKNHVLHVRTNNWGGAPEAAQKWYQKTVTELKQQNWNEAAYSAGVLSHYLTDPLMPFHTAQSEAENNIHRALEWSVANSYDFMRTGIEEACDEIEIVTSNSNNWLEEMLIAGANFSNQDYELLIKEYNFEAGVKDPLLGLNVFCRLHLSEHLAYAQMLHAYVLEKAIIECGVKPPSPSGLTIAAVFSLVKTPIYWILRKFSDSSERRQVAAMYHEYRETGTVQTRLPEDVKAIRDLVRKEKPAMAPPLEQSEILDFNPPNSDETIVEQQDVAPHPIKPLVSLEQPATAEPTEEPKNQPVETQKKSIDPTPVAIHSSDDDLNEKTKDTGNHYTINNLVEIPSIGKRTASHLTKAGIHNVAEFLAADPYKLAKTVDRDYIDAETLQTWQYQAELKIAIPKLRAHDIQILVQSGFYSIEMVAECDPHNLLIDILPFVESEQGQSIIRPGDEPDFNEVESWIEWAVQAVGIEEASAA